MLKPITCQAPKIEEGKKLDLPWHLIKSEFTCAAMDKNRKVHVFRDPPKLRLTVWIGDAGGNLNALNIDTLGIDFKESLTMRADSK